MNQIIRLTAIALISSPLLTIFFADAAKANQFEVCMERLVDSGISVTEAQTGCATALLPRQLSSCVRNITSNTEITPTDALQNCYRVRRPIDMGNCVVDISRDTLANYQNTNNRSQTETENTETDLVDTSTSITQESPLMLALNTCRASLLPGRHSECVIALSSTPEATSPVEAMQTCLKAEDFPRDLFPAY